MKYLEYSTAAKTIRITSCLLLLFFAISCSSHVEKVNISTYNPISYEYSYSLEAVKNAATKAMYLFSFPYYGDKRSLKDISLNFSTCLAVETQDNRIFSKDLGLGANDIYLHSFSNYYVSNVYYSTDRKTPLRIRAEYVIHFTKVNESKTKVLVTTLNHKVVTGKRWFPSLGPCGFWHPPVEIDAPTSTVEEYEILLKIGEILNQNDMPTLRIPDRIYMARNGSIEK